MYLTQVEFDTLNIFKLQVHEYFQNNSKFQLVKDIHKSVCHFTTFLIVSDLFIQASLTITVFHNIFKLDLSILIKQAVAKLVHHITGFKLFE
jgi:hypothetical protein